MDSSYDMGKIDALIGRVFSIEDITAGNPQKDFIVRYRGKLRMEDSEATFNQLSEQLAPYGITPLFRWDDERHSIILTQKRPQPKPSNPWVNLILFILTFISVTLVGGLSTTQVSITDLNSAILGLSMVMWAGIPFSVSLLSILSAHEFGHYFMCRRYNVNATLPYFIPFPSLLGTMGAVILMKEQPKNRRQLLDIGLAGPLAGLAVTIPVLLLGLSLSKLDSIPAVIPTGVAFQLEGNSILYLLLKFIMFGKLLPSPASFGALPEWLYWLQFFFTGRPYPLGGLDVMIHPVALAGWAGILVTALNLIPAGQLDGGHVLYVLIGRKRMARLLPFIIGAVVLLGIFSASWWLWAVLLFFFGRRFDEPDDQITPLDPGRRRVAILAMVLFVLVFTPVPLNFIGSI
ncbi:MAG: site-2 protease family protein [Anaerolineaceae bacterium]|nr:site-2 protease family protein [Anaerolineaceae bacterium]